MGLIGGLGIAGIAGIAGSLGSAAIGANAAGNASNAQVQAANQAAQLQYQESQNALDFQKQQWNTSQQNLAPWLNTGRSGLNRLSYLMGLDPGNGGTATGTAPGALPPPSSPGGFQPNTAMGAAPGMYPPYGNPMPAGSGPPSGINSAGGPGGPPVSSFGMNGGPNLQAPGGGTDALHSNLQAISNLPGDGSSGAGMGTATMPGMVPGTPGAPTGTQDLAPGGFGSLMQGWNTPFVAPTGATEQNDPGYQFRLSQGTDAIDRSAAASGNLFTGGTGKALTQFGQDYASNEYGNVYNRAMGQYAQNYNIFNNNQANQFNRLAAISGIGQTTANQLGVFGQQAANNVGNIDLATGQQIGNNLNNAGAARGSGYVGGANAWSGALGGASSNLMNLYLLQGLLGQGPGDPGSGAIPGLGNVV